MYERTIIKRIVFNNQIFNIVIDGPSRYDDQYWHHIQIIHHSYVLVNIQSPSRKLLYAALKRALLLCSYSAIDDVVWPETIRVDVDISGKHEAWLKEQEDNMAKRALEIKAEKEAIPHYVPSLLDILKNNRSRLEHSFSLSIDNAISLLGSKTERELDELFDFNLKHADRFINIDLHMANAIFIWLHSNGLLNHSLPEQES